MRVELFIQGMRRSSTTFLFDVLLADPRSHGWYEPLAEALRPAIGGGSRMSEVDFFAELREARTRFAAQAGLHDVQQLNHGAPRDAALELTLDLPPLIQDYVSFLCESARFTVLKFVRAWRKLDALLAARPAARVVHIVRDPRAVATSFLFGKGGKFADRFQAADPFFEQRGPVKGNQALAIADCLIDRGELSIDVDAPHVLKLLGVWQHHFRSSHRDGTRLGERYLLIRHEDLLLAPVDTMQRVYALIGRPLPDEVRSFLSAKLDPRQRIFAPEDPRWDEMIDRLELTPELDTAGYR